MIKFKKLIKKMRIYYNNSLLRNKKVTIISNNCWGGFMYQEYNLPYNSPFIGLFLFAPDYIKMLENLKEYLNKELIFIERDQSQYTLYVNSSYPIGLLNDVEIHFLHYKSNDEAKRKWNKRVQRINFDNMIIKFCDRDLCTPELIQKFDLLPYPNKVCFTAKLYPQLKSVIVLKALLGQEMVSEEWKHSKSHYNFRKEANRITH